MRHLVTSTPNLANALLNKAATSPAMRPPSTVRTSEFAALMSSYPQMAPHRQESGDSAMTLAQDENHPFYQDDLPFFDRNVSIFSIVVECARSTLEPVLT